MAGGCFLRALSTSLGFLWGAELGYWNWNMLEFGELMCTIVWWLFSSRVKCWLSNQVQLTCAALGVRCLSGLVQFHNRWVVQPCSCLLFISHSAESQVSETVLIPLIHWYSYWIAALVELVGHVDSVCLSRRFQDFFQDVFVLCCVVSWVFAENAVLE